MMNTKPSAPKYFYKRFSLFSLQSYSSTMSTSLVTQNGFLTYFLSKPTFIIIPQAKVRGAVKAFTNYREKVKKNFLYLFLKLLSILMHAMRSHGQKVEIYLDTSCTQYVNHSHCPPPSHTFYHILHLDISSKFCPAKKQ